MRKLAWTLGLVAAVVTACVAGPVSAAEAKGKGGGFKFGVIPQSALEEAEYRQMRAGGIDELRVGLFWSEAEPFLGALNWESFDRLALLAAQRKVTLFPYLYGTPRWASLLDGHIACTGDCSTYAPSSAATRNDFAEFAADAVARYGPGGQFWAENPGVPYRPIRTWQVWNEQNSSKYFAPEPDVGSYAALLAATAPAIRSVDPKADIVVGGMWGPKGSDEVVPTADYVKELYRVPGAKETFDSIGVHPYSSTPNAVLKQLNAVRKAARRSGDRKVGLWVTELGWASGGPKGHYLVKSKKGQARMLKRSYGELLERRKKWKIRGAFWYAWQDTPPTAGICAWCPWSGLRSASGAPKPAYRAMKRLAKRH